MTQNEDCASSNISDVNGTRVPSKALTEYVCVFGKTQGSDEKNTSVLCLSTHDVNKNYLCMFSEMPGVSKTTRVQNV